MAVLSDRTIQGLISNGQLILNGDPAMARHSSYRFTAGKLYHGGPTGRVVDWTQGSTPGEDAIQPGEYVWVRMREQVSIPPDIIALWWQTNSLSRKGLVLMNMSVVEPGYRGPLSCLFVNFGQLPVSVQPGQSLAKLVFHQLDHPSPMAPPTCGAGAGGLRAYDQEIHTEALQRPATFLQVTEQLDDQLGEISKARSDALDAIAEAKQQLIDESKAEFRRDIPRAVLKAGGYTAGALALLIAISSATPWVQRWFKPDLSDHVETAVQQELARRVLLEGALSGGEYERQRAELLKKLSDLEGRLHAVEGDSTQQ